MDRKNLPNVEKIEVTKVEQTEGVFQNENGQNFPFKTRKIFFRVEGYPVEFKATVDKTIGDYLEEALGEDEGF